jgi:mono/diheme cytochrome c family protein
MRVMTARRPWFSGLAGCALLSLSAALAGRAAGGGAPARPVGKQVAKQSTAAPAPEAARLTAGDFFEARIRPLLVENCYACHGPDRQMAGLRLDSRAAMLKGGAHGPALIPGEPDKSALIRAVHYTGAIKMPPPGKLPASAIDALTIWVKLGAPWPETSAATATAGGFTITAAQQSHWAFQPVRKPPLPAVKDTAWPSSPIDFFILHSLEQKGLRPNRPADKITLLRRATFDLTGLPPTIAEIDAFLADHSPNAFARVVDRLLASPHYGERWGRHWLDVARYADTKGYVFNEDARYPNAYTYRDYVIRAFNEDLPYNRFILEQVAADRLLAQQAPDASRQAPDKAAASAMPGSGAQTLASSVSRRPLRGAPPAEPKAKLAAMGFLTLGRRFLNNPPDIIDDRIDVVSRGLMGLTVACARCHNHKFDPIPQKDYYSLYGVFASSTEPAPVVITPTSQNEPYFAHEKQLKETEEQAETLAQSQQERLLAQLRASAADYMLAAHELSRSPEAISAESWAEKRGLNPLVFQRWQHFLAETPRRFEPVFRPWKEAIRASTPDDTKKPDAAPLNPLVARTLGDHPPTAPAELAQRYGALFAAVEKQWQALQTTHRIAAALAADTGAKAPEPPSALPDADADAVRQALYGRESPLKLETEALEPYFEASARDSLKALREKAERLRQTLPPAPRYAMTLEDAKDPHNVHVFLRGNPRNPGEEAPRQFLQIVAGEKRRPFQDGSGRLELAQAIASPANPLTARVMVNRIWLHHFGEGLVRTPSDFGMRSDPPTNPGLLDYLAARFVELGWSIKKLHRLIMLSSAYRMSSDDNPRGHKIDPENRLLWRVNRRRLELEPLRDSLLAVAGRLDPAIGGPAVEITKPPYPTRRTVYGFIDRQNLQNLFRTFDFASPDTTNAQRHETTVPQQALFMMNSPFVEEQARAVAARPDVLAYPEPARRIRYLYRLLFGRLPTADEVNLGFQFLKQAPTAPSPPSALTQTSLTAAPGAEASPVKSEEQKPNAGKEDAPKPLTAWEQYVQVLLMTNEFAFVD